jgi:adenylate cyclase
MIDPMATEIERKFLLANDAWRAQVVESRSMAQGYLSAQQNCSVRVRISDREAEINIKSATLGIERKEFEFSIPAGEAQAMLDSFCGDRLVSKIRHFVPYEGHTWEIDEFRGANDGLIVAEIELASSDQTFARPPWLGREVSADPRYYNVKLIDHPYRDWPP